MKRLIKTVPLFLFVALALGCSSDDEGVFTSTGTSRGAAQSTVLIPAESYGGLLTEIEVAVLYDAGSDTFVGRLRNEAAEAICDVNVDVILDGSAMINTTEAGVPLEIAGLHPRGRTEFTLAAGGAMFSDWAVRLESFTCSRTPPNDGGGEDDGGHEGGDGEGGEEGGHEGGEGEGGHEGGEGGEGEGGEEGEEGSPPIPLDEPFEGVFNDLNFSFAWDDSASVFRGVVDNRAAQRVCRSRTEIHIGVVGDSVVELGPTIDLDLDPGDISDIVIEPADASVVRTYTLHPESSPCQ